MFKIFIFSIQMLIGFSAFASNSYVGNWCNRFDDFTSVIIINSEDQVFAWTVGNEAGEHSLVTKGYVSLGASNFDIVLDNYDLGVTDFKVGQKLFSNKRTLTLFFDDGTREKYTECILSEKK